MCEDKSFSRLKFRAARCSVGSHIFQYFVNGSANSVMPILHETCDVIFLAGEAPTDVQLQEQALGP